MICRGVLAASSSRARDATIWRHTFGIRASSGVSILVFEVGLASKPKYTGLEAGPRRAAFHRA